MLTRDVAQLRVAAAVAWVSSNMPAAFSDISFETAVLPPNSHAAERECFSPD
jgi:hypothetical protein